jgi:hypothetical protein
VPTDTELGQTTLSAGRGNRWVLVNALRQAVGAYQRIEDGQHMAPIVDHAGKNIAEMRVALAFAVPLGEDGAGDFNVAAQLVGGMAAQEESIKKGGFALREFQILQDVHGNGLWNSRHREKRSLPKSFAASSRTYDFLPRC